jgi:hypothetical protein
MCKVLYASVSGKQSPFSHKEVQATDGVQSVLVHGCITADMDATLYFLTGRALR